MPLDHFQLYQPLRVLLQLDLDELLKLQEELPRLTPIQNKQLLQMLQMQPYDVLELRNLMAPYEFNNTSDMITDTLPTSSITSPQIGYDVTTPPPPPDKYTVMKSDIPRRKLSLQIVEQPPEKSVYKRNLKPNPMVMVVGDQKMTGNLFVAVSLVRCDTFQEEPKFLTGNKPERVTPGKVVTFR